MKSNNLVRLQYSFKGLLGLLLVFITSTSNATINECGNDVNELNEGIGFNGYYAPENWTLDDMLGLGSVSMNSLTATVVGPNNIGINNTQAFIEATVIAGGTFSFNWSWTTLDGPSFDPAFYQVGPDFFQLTNSSGTTSQSGSISFFASAGTVIRMGVQSTDGCCGAGTLVVSQLIWPGQCVNPCGNYLIPGEVGSGFSGYYELASWNFDNETGDGSATITDAFTLEVVGNNDQNAGSNTRTDFMTSAALAGEINFTWTYITEDTPGFDPAFFVLNGVVTPLSNNIGTTQTGTFNFNASAGTTFGFRVTSVDGCCGAATLIITNFTWPGDCLLGCTNPLSCNYNSLATLDDGSCLLLGCSDALACNFDPAAECTDNSLCMYPGCTDTSACNFDPNAICAINSTCTYPGCNNPLACNYDEIAGCNDGSCILPPTNDICSNAMPWTNNFSNQTFSNANTCNDDPISCETDDGFTQNFFNDVWFSFVATGGTVNIITLVGGSSDCSPYIAVYENCNGNLIQCSQPLFTESCLCFFSIGLTLPCGSLTQGSTYFVRVGGDLFNDLTPEINPTLNSGTFRISFNQNNFAPGTLFGCTDPEACNFTPGAVCGVCNYPGCNDPIACNYNPNAGCNDSSCIYSLCTDPNACNYIADICIEEPCEYPDCNGICGGYSALNNCDECAEPTILIEEIIFNYTGQEESYVIPENTIKVEFELIGASGGFSNFSFGHGGRAKGLYYPNAGDVLYVNVGGRGELPAGGYNGGGDGGFILANGGGGGGGGGGASDIRLLPGDLSSRIIVAGGGGGGTSDDQLYTTPGGSGGGLVGVCAGGNCSSAGTQVSGGVGSTENGSFGIGGNGALGNEFTAGGGGGWYGGGANFNSVGGGGSSYIDGVSFGFTEANVQTPNGNGSVSIRVTKIFNTQFCFPGCTDPTAINYASAAIFDDGSCLYAGCMDPTAVNYNPVATFGDNTCIYVLGCTYEDALNYNMSAQQDDGTCQFDQSNTCPADLNNDGLVGITDLLVFVSAYGTVCP